jgi:hypothetical protein
MRNMLLTVADRFSFGERELWALPISRLHWWYEGAVELYRQDKGE